MALESASPLPPEELVRVLAQMHEGVQLIDRAWRYVFVNAAAAAHGRRPAEELVGRTMMECYPGIDQTSMFDSLRGCMERGEPATLENEFRYPDGRTGTFELRVTPCDLGITVLSIDVTDRRRLEAQLRHAQKMEAIGRLAGSVAHDFNNVLSVILSFSALLLEDIPSDDPRHADVQAIKRAGERATDLTRQLLSFSRQSAIRPRLLDVSAVLREGESTLRRLAGETIALSLQTLDDLPPVLVDPGQLDQIVMNLVANARDAMPDGGKLTIETRAVMLDATYASEHFGVTPGPHVMLAVSDTGRGMDRDTQARIFEPFFTTKEPGKGTGIGLATVFGIVKQSRGNVWVYSEVGKGSTFKVYLPAAVPYDVAHGELEPATRGVATSVAGSETILLVEDQDDVRIVTREVLRRHGYVVLEARNAGEALLTCERHAEPIHLLLTDVVMPQMGGRELADRLVLLRSDLRVVFMSGYTETGVVHHDLLAPGIAYLQKPLVPDQLARKVRDVLDRPIARLVAGAPTSSSQGLATNS